VTRGTHEPGHPGLDSGEASDRALFGWSPARLPADCRTKRWVDRILPATGPAVIAYFTTIVGLVATSAFLPTRPGLIVIAIAALGGSLWCSANFWRCRHAHCLVTGAGWLLLTAFAVVEATLGRSFIAGAEPIVFLIVFGASLAFERYWVARRGTNAVISCS
jgi:hypothetical protein